MCSGVFLFCFLCFLFAGCPQAKKDACSAKTLEWHPQHASKSKTTESSILDTGVTRNALREKELVTNRQEDFTHVASLHLFLLFVGGLFFCLVVCALFCFLHRVFVVY